MKSLYDSINESHISMLLHELHEGDMVEFQTSGHTVIGEIITLGDKDKVVVKTTGFRYKSEEEKKEIESKLKAKYTVAAKRCALLHFVNKK